MRGKEDLNGIVGKRASGFSNGVNLQPSHYNKGNVDLGWSLMKKYPGIKTVRIEIEPGTERHAQRWIREAEENGYDVIATYHKFNSLLSDDPGELLAAGQWWKDHFHMLGGGFTINLMNEWGSHHIGAPAFASAYNEAIALVRQVYDGPIIIDCPGGGQGTTLLATAVMGVNGIRIADSHIILSAHVYPNGYNSCKMRNSQISDLDDLEATGRPCMIGEFGSMLGVADQTDWSAMVDHAKAKGWPVLAWAWNGDGGKMNMISPQFQPFARDWPKRYDISDYFDIVYDKL